MHKRIKSYNRRDFIKTGLSGAISLSSIPAMLAACAETSGSFKFVVSIVRKGDQSTRYAVEKAIDLLGGIISVTQNKERILLKPNLVGDLDYSTTKPEVIEALVLLMKGAGKEVTIGEGSAAAGGFNVVGPDVYRTRKSDILDGMQKHVFDKLGYGELAESNNIQLINFHGGDLVEVQVEDGLFMDKIILHKSIAETDMLCSVPMMKTHVLATVTLGLKNLIGLYPGSEYYSVRSWLHDRAAEAGSPGIAFEILDIVRATKPGLTVIDGTTAMEGDGPSEGTLVDMGLIIASSNPLAADMVASKIMGFEPHKIPHLSMAMKAGLGPASLSEIEIRGDQIEDVKRPFIPPSIYNWTDINQVWGNKEL